MPGESHHPVKHDKQVDDALLFPTPLVQRLDQRSLWRLKDYRAMALLQVADLRARGVLEIKLLIPVASAASGAKGVGESLVRLCWVNHRFRLFFASWRQLFTISAVFCAPRASVFRAHAAGINIADSCAPRGGELALAGRGTKPVEKNNHGRSARNRHHGALL